MSALLSEEPLRRLYSLLRSDAQVKALCDIVGAVNQTAVVMEAPEGGALAIASAGGGLAAAMLHGDGLPTVRARVLIVAATALGLAESLEARAEEATR